ncbi:MAG: hypothetical protein P9M14_13495 [Candidatus Alcyoniella australis]|nr:hypothetical protein [Candidatus Alcyoniella australis]
MPLLAEHAGHLLWAIPLGAFSVFFLLLPLDRPYKTYLDIENILTIEIGLLKNRIQKIEHNRNEMQKQLDEYDPDAARLLIRRKREEAHNWENRLKSASNDDSEMYELIAVMMNKIAA